ncbi:MAG: serine acetyltransferase [Marinilabiliaceae bacterium]|nr:serine acetyltransferase [Marinilabiliaceae bacterium]
MTSYKYPKELKKAIDELANESSYQSVCHRHLHNQPMPSTQQLKEIVDLLREIIFPGYFGHSEVRCESIHYYLGVNTERVFHLLVDQIHAGLCFSCSGEDQIPSMEIRNQAFDMATRFIACLPELRRKLSTDVEAAFLGDPAAQSRGEVIFCYPAIRAITNYRIAHALLTLGVPLIPRMISEMAHSETGIDIHPNAQIGESFTIDHGTGVVIGATSIIGKNVKLFQGVTLGAKSFPLDENGNPIKGIPRHPIVQDDVIIYAQATILGRITVGAGSTIGGNVWVTNNVPPGSKIVQFKPKEMLYSDGGGI